MATGHTYVGLLCSWMFIAATCIGTTGIHLVAIAAADVSRYIVMIARFLPALASDRMNRFAIFGTDQTG